MRVLLGGGLALVGAGLLAMRGLEVGDEWTVLLPGFLLAGAGIGMANPGIASTAIGVVAAARAGMASGINTTFRQVGIATGVAALGAIFQSRIEARLTELMPGVPGGLGEAIASGGSRAAIESAPPGTADQISRAADQAFVSGLNDILLVGAIIAFAGAALGFALVRPRDFVGRPAADPVPSEA